MRFLKNCNVIVIFHYNNRLRTHGRLFPVFSSDKKMQALYDAVQLLRTNTEQMNRSLAASLCGTTLRSLWNVPYLSSPVRLTPSFLFITVCFHSQSL